MRKSLPVFITGLLIVAALFFFAQKQKKNAAQEAATDSSRVEAVIWQMMDAARAGDGAAYLNCFTGELRQKLEKTRAEMGAQAFSEYLRRLDAELTGVAVSNFARRNEAEASLRVEFVYRGKNEAQQHRFQRINGVWKIAQVDGAERVNVLVPYGAPVVEQ
jgi:hypothetical protein